MNPDASPVLLLAPLYSFTSDADAATVENALELVLLLVQSSVEVRKAMLYGAAGASQFAPPLLLPPEVRSLGKSSSLHALTRIAARICTPFCSSTRSPQPAHTPRAAAVRHASRPAPAPATGGPWRRRGEQDPPKPPAGTAETPRPLARRARARVQPPLHRPRGLPGQRLSVCILVPHTHTHARTPPRLHHVLSAATVHFRVSSRPTSYLLATFCTPDCRTERTLSTSAWSSLSTSSLPVCALRTVKASALT